MTHHCCRSTFIMANKLTAENIEAAVQHLEEYTKMVQRQYLTAPIERVEDAEIVEPLDLGNQVIEKEEKRVFPLIPPNDPRLLMQVAPFMDDTLEQFGFASRTELVSSYVRQHGKVWRPWSISESSRTTISYVCYGRTPRD